jgi:hypothetical protein
MARAPTDPRTIDRFAELVGLGCTQHEAARAVGISERHGERLLARSQVRARVEEARTRRNGTPLTSEVRSVLDDLLNAVDDKGVPAASGHERPNSSSSTRRSSTPSTPTAHLRSSCRRA